MTGNEFDPPQAPQPPHTLFFSLFWGCSLVVSGIKKILTRSGRLAVRENRKINNLIKGTAKFSGSSHRRVNIEIR